MQDNISSRYAIVRFTPSPHPVIRVAQGNTHHPIQQNTTQQGRESVKRGTTNALQWSVVEQEDEDDLEEDSQIPARFPSHLTYLAHLLWEGSLGFGSRVALKGALGINLIDSQISPPLLFKWIRPLCPREKSAAQSAEHELVI